MQNNPIIFIDQYGLAFSAIFNVFPDGFYSVGQAIHTIIDLGINGPPAAKAALWFTGATEAAPLLGAASIASPTVYQFAQYSQAIVDYVSSAVPGTTPAISRAGALGAATNYVYHKFNNLSFNYSSINNSNLNYSSYATFRYSSFNNSIGPCGK